GGGVGAERGRRESGGWGGEEKKTTKTKECILTHTTANSITHTNTKNLIIHRITFFFSNKKPHTIYRKIS
ncbi:hypothetical protein J3336_10210, partial [Leuconostoc mesenteroides]|uniref:hypothetical protein n=1 Tax=Leuconostoc mesenteroides TaxID=1245 RepID=UPI001CC1410F